jgi:hypothetical protein
VAGFYNTFLSSSTVRTVKMGWTTNRSVAAYSLTQHICKHAVFWQHVCKRAVSPKSIFANSCKFANVLFFAILHLCCPSCRFGNSARLQTCCQPPANLQICNYSIRNTSEVACLQICYCSMFANMPPTQVHKHPSCMFANLLTQHICQLNHVDRFTQTTFTNNYLLIHILLFICFLPCLCHCLH